MAAVSHLGFGLRLVGITHEEYLVSYRCAKYGWNRQCRFENVRLSMLWEFGL